jgi:hypothetical protein
VSSEKLKIDSVKDSITSPMSSSSASANSSYSKEKKMPEIKVDDSDMHQPNDMKFSSDIQQPPDMKFSGSIQLNSSLISF